MIIVIITLINKLHPLTSTAVMKAPRLGGDRKPRQANTTKTTNDSNLYTHEMSRLCYKDCVTKIVLHTCISLCILLRIMLHTCNYIHYM